MARFTVWLQHHCPRLLEGIQQWLLCLLHGHALTQGAEQEVLRQVAGDVMGEVLYWVQAVCEPLPPLPPHKQLWQGRYHLPDLSFPKGGGAARPLPNSVVWALSCVLPLCYLGHKIGEHRSQVGS